jgi:hypothetical protein
MGDPRRRLRPWQSFLRFGDEDLLAFAALYEAYLMDKAFYYAQQAIEKYLKAVILKYRQRAGHSVSMRRTKKPRNPMLSHDLAKLVRLHREHEPGFRLPTTFRELDKITRWERTPRYPSQRRRFSSEDIELVERLVRHLRGTLRLRRDYWPLARGLAVTAELHRTEHDWNDEASFLHNITTRPWGRSAMALRRIFDDPDSIARFSPIVWRKPRS